MNAPTCGRSWGSPTAGWWFCNEPRGHVGPCACAGKPKPAGVLYFEEQPEAAEALRKQREKQVREDGRKV